MRAVVIKPFVDYWSNLFYLNETFTAALQDRVDKCGFTDYINKYYTFPPPEGPFPVLPEVSEDNPNCDIFDDVYYAALLANPCFNIYHITDTCPHLWNVLGIVNTGDYSPPGEVVYFNRSDVQKAINAPVGTNWMQCTMTNVFGGASNNPNLSDASLGPAQNGVLAHVIDTINNTFIGVGNLDFILPTNGSIFALQNVTWGGKQGFQEFPAQHDFYVPYHPEYNGGALSLAGEVGTWGYERGLTFYQVQLGGHGEFLLLLQSSSSCFGFRTKNGVEFPSSSRKKVAINLLTILSSRTPRLRPWRCLPRRRSHARPCPRPEHPRRFHHTNG